MIFDLLSDLFSSPHSSISKIQKVSFTGKSFSEAIILESTDPQCDKRLFIELQVHYMKIPSSEHDENMMCTQIVFCFCPTT